MENYQNLKYNRGFGNSFETEVIEGVIPKRNCLWLSQIRTTRSNWNMEFLRNSSAVQPSQWNELRIRNHGFTRWDLQWPKDNLKNPLTRSRSYKVTCTKKISSTILINWDGRQSLKPRKARSISSKGWFQFLVLESHPWNKEFPFTFIALMPRWKIRRFTILTGISWSCHTKEHFLSLLWWVNWQ